MTSYLNVLQNSQWHGSNIHTLRVGTTGLGGVSVKHITKKAQSDIVKWFQAQSVHLVENTQDVREDGLWWSFERFFITYPSENKDVSVCKGGYIFKMGKEAYQRIFPNKK